MKIAVIGAGNVGGTLAVALAKKGHAILLGVRDPVAKRYQDLAKRIGNDTRVVGLRDAATSADALLLATPWSATQSVLENMAGALEGKIILDCTNPITADFKLSIGHTSSGGEMVAAWAKGAHVYKVFNTIGYNIMEDPVLDERPALMLVCGDNSEHKLKVLQLAKDVGFEAQDFGKLENARLLEPMALAWIQLAFQQGLGRNFAFGLLRR